jgi:serine/threonine protein kinase
MHPFFSIIIIILDFSSSFREHQVIQGIVQSRFYRAPEVLLGIMPLSLPIDMWSLGCILFEMHTGEALLEGWRDEEQIFLVSEVSFSSMFMYALPNRGTPYSYCSHFSSPFKLIHSCLEQCQPPWFYNQVSVKHILNRLNPNGYCVLRQPYLVNKVNVVP